MVYSFSENITKHYGLNMNYKITLTRKQIKELKKLIKQVQGDDDVIITYGGGSGIGTNVYATVGFGEEKKTVDITDYENW